MTKKMFFVMMALIIAGCSTQRGTKVGMFEFNFDGGRYGILSTAEPGNGGGNMLVKKDDNHITLRAADYDKDGNIDSVIVGDVDRELANKIYKTGIEIAQNQNKFKSLQHERMYITSDPGYFKSYAILTFLGANQETYNKFIIMDHRSQIQTVIIDNGADGVLDMDDTEHTEYQKLYKFILDKGARDGKIKVINDQYLVSKE